MSLTLAKTQTDPVNRMTMKKMQKVKQKVKAPLVQSMILMVSIAIVKRNIYISPFRSRKKSQT